MLLHISPVQHVGSLLKSITVDIDSKEMKMAILKGLLRHYDNIITALDGLGDERGLYTLEIGEKAFYRTKSDDT